MFSFHSFCRFQSLGGCRLRVPAGEDGVGDFGLLSFQAYSKVKSPFYCWRKGNYGAGPTFTPHGIGAGRLGRAKVCYTSDKVT